MMMNILINTTQFYQWVLMGSSEVGKISVSSSSLLSTVPRPATPPESILVSGPELSTDCGQLFRSLDLGFCTYEKRGEVCG